MRTGLKYLLLYFLLLFHCFYYLFSRHNQIFSFRRSGSPSRITLVCMYVYCVYWITVVKRKFIPCMPLITSESFRVNTKYHIEYDNFDPHFHLKHLLFLGHSKQYDYASMHTQQQHEILVWEMLTRLKFVP